MGDYNWHHIGIVSIRCRYTHRNPNHGDITQMNREEFLKRRKLGIGGSDAGAILGVNPYATRMDIYMDKISADIDTDHPSEFAYWGTKLEDIVAEEYTLRTGIKVRTRNQQFSYGEVMLANLDFVAVGKSHILECKTAGQFSLHLWGEDGTDQVPDSYYIQAQHYMIVTGIHKLDMAVLIGGNEFRIYHLVYDSKLAELIIEKERAFWHENVLPKIPPEPTCLSDLAALYGRDSGKEVLSNELVEMHCKSIKQVKADIKESELELKKLTFEVQKYMGKNAFLKDDDGRRLASWKTSKDIELFDKKRLQADKPHVYYDYIKMSPGTRRFLIK